MWLTLASSAPLKSIPQPGGSSRRLNTALVLQHPSNRRASPLLLLLCLYLEAAVATVFEIATFPLAKVLHSRSIENVVQIAKRFGSEFALFTNKVVRSNGWNIMGWSHVSLV